MARKKAPSRGRVRQSPLEPITPARPPGKEKPLFEPVFESKHQPEPLALSDRDRIQAAEQRRLQLEADNAAAEARPSQPTPQQLKRAEHSQALRENLKLTPKRRAKLEKRRAKSAPKDSP